MNPLDINYLASSIGIVEIGTYGEFVAISWANNLPICHRTENSLRISEHDPQSSPDTTFGVSYGVDEDGLRFATIGFNLPSQWLAEIEDGTYGELQGIRIYPSTWNISVS